MWAADKVLPCGSAGMALGMVMQLPDAENEHSINRQQLQAKLDVAMGGARPSPISHASSLPASVQAMSVSSQHIFNQHRRVVFCRHAATLCVCAHCCNSLQLL